MADACNDKGPMVFTILNATDVYSPNYPGHYPNNMHCTWKFSSVNGYRIQFKIVQGGEIETEYDILAFKINYKNVMLNLNVLFFCQL